MPPLCIKCPAEEFPLGIGYRRRGRKKTKMMGQPEDRKSFKVGSAVLIQYRRISDRQPPMQPRRRSKYTRYMQYYLRRAVKINY